MTNAGSCSEEEDEEEDDWTSVLGPPDANRPEHDFQRIVVTPAVQGMICRSPYPAEEQARGVLIPGEARV